MSDSRPTPTTVDYAGRPVPLASPATSPRRRRVVAMATVCALLLAGAAGLNAAVASLKLSFRKLPVPLRKDVTAIPAELGPWVQVSLDQRLPEDIEKELRTLQYVQRLYVDTRKADPAVLARWRAAAVKDQALRAELERSVIERDPAAAVRLHVAYYTGAVDTVPHIPDRCMVAGGYDPVGRREELLDMGGGRTMRTSFVQFQESAGHARPKTLSVAYFFQVNGDYEHDPITGVRRRLQNLLEKHGYFAKIELMTEGPASGEGAAAGAGEAAKASMGDFLRHALPQIEAALPDWQQVTSGGAAPAGEAP